MSGTVLLLGAGGFLAGFIEAALRQAGWQVRRVVRTAVREGDVVRDLGAMLEPADWQPLLEGVDAVVNAARRDGDLLADGAQSDVNSRQVSHPRSAGRLPHRSQRHSGPLSSPWKNTMPAPEGR